MKLNFSKVVITRYFNGCMDNMGPPRVGCLCAFLNGPVEIAFRKIRIHKWSGTLIFVVRLFSKFRRRGFIIGRGSIRGNLWYLAASKVIIKFLNLPVSKTIINFCSGFSVPIVTSFVPIVISIKRSIFLRKKIK